MATGQWPQDLWQQRQVLPGLVIGPQCDFIRRAAIEVGPGCVTQHALRMVFVVRQADHAFWQDVACR